MIPILGFLFGTPVFTFGFLLSCAFCCGVMRSKRDIAHAGLEISEGSIYLVFLFGLFSGSFLGVFSFVSDVSEINQIFSCFSALLGNIVAVAVLSFSLRLSLYKTLCSFFPGVLLMFSIMQLGAHLSGDGTYGSLTQSSWGMSFLTGTVPTAAGFRAYPAALFWSVSSALVLAVTIKRYDNKKQCH